MHEHIVINAALGLRPLWHYLALSLFLVLAAFGAVWLGVTIRSAFRDRTRRAREESYFSRFRLFYGDEYRGWMK